MSKNINMEVWVTQQSLAAEMGVKVQCVNNWIFRGKIKAMKIEGSRLVLVDKTTAPVVNSYKSRKK